MLSSCLFNYQEFPFSGVQLFCMFRNPVSSPCERLTFSGKTTVLLRSCIFQISFHPLFRGSPLQGFPIQHLCSLRCNQDDSLFRVRRIRDYVKMATFFREGAFILSLRLSRIPFFRGTAVLHVQTSCFVTLPEATLFG